MSETTREKICVVFPGALGDFLCFFPTLRALATRAPVTLFARTEFADIVPAAVHVRSLECHEISRLFVPDAAREERLNCFFRSYASIYSWLGSQQREFVQSLHSVSQGRARVFPFRPQQPGIHQAHYYRSCIGEAPRALLPIPEIAPNAKAKEWCESYWVRHLLKDKRVLVVAPGSGAKEKNWPAEYFRATADWWQDKVQGVVVVLVGPVEEERSGWEPSLAGFLVARKLSLAQAAALLSRADLYLGNDSGITHLAAAVGVRTVALFGPSDVRQWAPRGKRVTILNRNVECSPYGMGAMKNCSHRRRLTTVSPETVISRLQKLPELATLTRWRVGIKV